MKLHKKIIEVVENNNFTISEVGQQGIDFYVELEQFTPYGEDWSETIWFDGTDNGFINAVIKRYYDFDVDEEVEIWIEHRGKNGVPNSIKDLLVDAEWKEHMFDLLTSDLALLEMYKDEDEEEYVPSAENGDYSPSNPWDAPGMSINDFI